MKRGKYDWGEAIRAIWDEDDDMIHELTDADLVPHRTSDATHGDTYTFDGVVGYDCAHVGLTNLPYFFGGLVGKRIIVKVEVVDSGVSDLRVGRASLQRDRHDDRRLSR